MSRWIGVILLVALGCAACSGEAPQTQAGPSTAGAALQGAPSVTQGARIMGSVSAGVPPGATAAQVAGTWSSSPAGYASAGAPLAAMTAHVVGTSISSPVGPGGGFSLEGVPAGAVQLRFVGSGVDASVGLSPVQAGDVVSVLVSVAGTTAAVQCESRNAGGKVELEGRIESVTQVDASLVVAGWTVTTNTLTVFRDGNNATKAFADLAVGQRVHVKGMLGADAVVADSVLIQNTNAAVPVNVNGIVDELSGSAASFEFLIGGRKIKGDSTTVLYGDSGGSLPFAALKDGLRVEVKGEMRDAHVFALRIHINGGEMEDPPQDDSASVEGKLVVIDPAIPLPPAPVTTPPKLTIRSTVGGATVDTVVTTTFSTEVRRRGDVQTLAALAVGQTIHAVGTRMADKTLAAKMLQIKDDEPEGAFVIEGSLGGLKGTCPVINFGVNGYTVKTSAATKYYPDVPAPGAKCEDLKGGTKVEVEGKRQADGSVLADKVTKK